MKNAVRALVFAALVAWTSGASAASRDVNLGFTVMQWINALEVYAGKQVTERGEDAEVKAYAQAAVDRHTQWANDLIKFAEEKKIDGLDIKEETSDPTVSKLIDYIVEAQALKDLKGAELDKAFVGLMVKVHQFSLKNIEDCTSRIGESEEATFLTNLSPQLKEGLEKAQALATRLGSDND